jgi:predicted  nucleic acid-binding Zn-ribbon protein
MKVNMTKAKEIAHARRRSARSEEFKPWDLKATIPSEATQAEAERQKIRDKYASIQEKMDAAKSVKELAELIPKV